MRLFCADTSGIRAALGRRRRQLTWLAAAGLLGWMGVSTEAAETRIGAAGGESPESDYLVSFWHTAQGLPNNTVNAILQTRDGFLWVGTAAGLARFDGLNFTIPPETTGGLRDTVITALLEDKEGKLWVGTQGKGVFRLGPRRAENLTVNEGPAGKVVTSLAEDLTGVIWVGTQEGLYRWQEGKLSPFSSAAVSQGDSIVALHAGLSGTLWITTRSGLFRLVDGQTTAFKSDQLPQGRNAEFIGAYEDRSKNLWAYGATFLLNVTQGRSLNNFPSFNVASSRVWTICEQSNGDFWIGTSGSGLRRFQNGRFEVVGAREGLEQNEIRALHADRWGNLWIGTGGNGLARLRTRRLRLIGGGEGLDSQNLSTIASDGKGGLWVGTTDSGLWHCSGRRPEPWTGGGPLARVTRIQSLCLDTQGALWVGTWGAGLIELNGARQRRLTTADGLSDDVVLAVAAGRADRSVWAGTHAGSLHRIRGGEIETLSAADGLTGTAILCLLPTSDKGLLIGSESGGLVEWNGTNLVKVSGPPELSTLPIRALLQDKRGGLWVGTWGGGAYCRRGENWTTLARREGLASERVGLIAQGDTGDIWFSTAENLFKARPADVESLVAGGTRRAIPLIPALAGAIDGLRCAAGWPAAARTSDNTLWLACGTELLPLGQTESLGSEPPPPVVFERVLVNGQPQPLPESGRLRLGPGTRSLDVEFNAIAFSAPQKVRFRYKLENLESEWVESDVARRAHYSPLPPGDYRFRVIAANAEGLWNEAGATLDLTVVAPVWRSWWFLCLAGSACVAAIWASARFISTRRLEARLRVAEQRHAMDRERTRIAQDMHDEIGSKLTRISFLSEIARHEGAENPASSRPVDAIATTSRELLQALDEIVWAVNPRNDNLEHLAGYLEQHTREYFQATACECVIHVPAELPSAPLSAEVRHNVFLAFEEALNNCLKHARAHKVTVSMRVEPNSFDIQVRDDGCGFNAGGGSGPEQDGLHNMRERLRRVGGTCEVESRPGAGTLVTLRFPLTRGRRPAMVAAEHIGTAK